jgi:hypothetical protein
MAQRTEGIHVGATARLYYQRCYDEFIECTGFKSRPRGVVPFSHPYTLTLDYVDGIGDRLQRNCPFFRPAKGRPLKGFI